MKYPAILLATTPSFARTEELALASGRFVADADVADAKRVIVLGHEIRELLFPYDDPVGSGVKIAGEWYSVVGALAPREVGGEDHLAVRAEGVSLFNVGLTQFEAGDAGLRVRLNSQFVLDDGLSDLVRGHVVVAALQVGISSGNWIGRAGCYSEGRDEKTVADSSHFCGPE